MKLANINELSGIRALTPQEREYYSGAVIKAVQIVPSFRDSISLMNPYFDGTATTAYTDEHARVGLSSWFFNEIDATQRATVILHESMHVLNNHFVRSENYKMKPHLSNIAGDFEINSTLSKLNYVDLSVGILPDMEPWEFKKFLSMEQYYALLHDIEKEQQRNQEESGESDEQNSGSSGQSQNSDSSSNSEGNSGGSSEQSGSDSSQNVENDSSPSENNSQSGGGDDSGEDDGESQAGGNSSSSSSSSADGNSSSSGGGSVASKNSNEKSSGKMEAPELSCDKSTSERSSAADAAGISRASDSEKTIAKKNTLVRIEEEVKKNKARGNGSSNSFLKLAAMQMTPPKVQWQSIFRRIMLRANDNITRGRADYSYRRVNRRASGSEFVFPGMVQYIPSVMMAVDTSGSMSHSDYRNLLSEVEGIIRACGTGKDNFSVFSIDTKVQNMKKVKKTKEIQLQGGGGTDISLAFRHVNEMLPKDRPDILVVATDCGTDWRSMEHHARIGLNSYKIVLLATDASGFTLVPESFKKLVPVIDVSGDK